MKNLSFLTFALFLLIQPAFADYGSCVLYQSKIYLKDGSSFNSNFEVCGEGPGAWLDDSGSNEFCSDEGILTLLKERQKNSSFYNEMDGGIQKPEDFGKILLYKKIDYLKLKKMKAKSYESLYARTFGFVQLEDLVFVDTSEIAQTIFWAAEVSHRDWVNAEIIFGSSGMLDTLQNFQYWSSITIDLENSKEDSIVFSDDSMWGYQLINFSAQINVEEMKRLARLKFPHRIENRIWKQMRREHNIGENEVLPKDLNRIGLEKIERRYQQMKEWFWKRGLVMVRISQGC